LTVAKAWAEAAACGRLFNMPHNHADVMTRDKFITQHQAIAACI
jgi:hypothetical protein